MGMTVETRVEWNGAPELVAAMSEAVHEATQDGAALTKQWIVAMGAVDTGNMLNSVDGHLAAPGEGGPLVGKIEVQAPYAVYVHEGYHLVAWGHPTGRYISGRPFLANALVATRAILLAKLRALGLRGGR